jgi:hypothetical protein
VFTDDKLPFNSMFSRRARPVDGLSFWLGLAEDHMPPSTESNKQAAHSEASGGAVPTHTELQLPLTPPFKRARAVALAQILAHVLPLNDIEILELQLFRDYFDALIQHAKEFFKSVFDELHRCDKEALRRLIADEEIKVNWSEIYADERARIAGREKHDYNEFITTVGTWEERLRGLPKPYQTPHLFMVYHHAIQVRDKFEMLMNGIKEKLPSTNVLIAPLKLPYRILEKMALEEPGKRWTAACVMDLQRGAIDCPNTGDMTKALVFLDACTSEVRRGERQNKFKGLVANLPEIRIVRMKNRFDKPTKGGWADIFINFVFAEDPNRHVHELQVQHSDLVLVRKRWGEDTRYAHVRVLAEFLNSAAHATVET